MIVAAALSPLFALLGAAATLQQPAAGSDFERLVPSNTVLLLRFSSLDEVAREAEWMRSTLSIEGNALTPAVIAKGLLKDFSIDLNAVDTARPLGIALILQGMGPPGTVAILPVKGGGSLSVDVNASGKTVSVLQSGSYAACSESVQLALAEGTPRLTNSRDLGLARVDIDLRLVMDTFGPMIDTGLDQVEQMIDSGMLQQEEMPLDMTEYLQLYLDFLRDLKDSTDTLSMAIASDGSVVDLRGEMRMLEKSPLAAWWSEEKVDFVGLARRLDPAASMQTMSHMDVSELMDAVFGMYDGLVDTLRGSEDVPSELADALALYIEKSQKVMSHIGPTSCASASFASDGLRWEGMYSAKDPKALSDEMMGLLSHDAFRNIGIACQTLSDASEGGVRKVTALTRIDWNKLLRVFNTAEEMDEATSAKIAAFADRLMGEGGLTTSMVAGDGDLYFAAGGDDAFRSAGLARLRAANATPNPAMAWLCTQIEGCNPASAAYFDLGQLMDFAYDLVAGLDEKAKTEAAVLQRLGERSLPMSFYWGVSDRAWRSGLRLERDSFAHVGRVIAEATKMKQAKPKDASDGASEEEAKGSPSDSQDV